MEVKEKTLSCPAILKDTLWDEQNFWGKNKSRLYLYDKIRVE